MVKKFFTLHWDEDMRVIMLLCDNIYCIHHRARENISLIKGQTNCGCPRTVIDACDFGPGPTKIRMFRGINNYGEPIKKNLLKDEKKECFIYREDTVSTW